MLFRALIVSFACACLPPLARAAERFPYVASVAGKETEIRSGPGERFFVTAKLRDGDEVEVYRHDVGGWCAICPPKGSYSWVFGDELQSLDEGTAEVILEGAKAFVGGSEKSRDVSHVALRRGERVVVLGSAQDQGTWYKIAPPSGEFRWIHSRHLRRGEEVAPDAKREVSTEQDDPHEEHVVPPPRSTSNPLPKEKPAPSEAWRPAPPDAVIEPPPPAAPAAPREAEREIPQTGWVRPGTAPRTSRAEPAGAHHEASHRVVDDRSPASEPHEDSPGNATLDRLELALSTMVCQPREQWIFDDLREKTKHALRQASGPVERGRARRLLERIARFEDVKRKSLGYGEGPARGRLVPITGASGIGTSAAPASVTATTKTITAAPIDEAPPPAPDPEDPRFDGTGRLVILQKREENDPQFMLVDEQGITKYFVTAAPGVNLRGYLDRSIGITGIRSEDPALGRPRITAQRVTVLPQRTAVRASREMLLPERSTDQR